MKIVVATEDELALVGDYPRDQCIVTGVGALNVIRALMDVDRNEPILNVGYAGSNSLPVGSKVCVGSCQLYHPNADFDSPVYDLCGDIPCFTSSDFVINTNICNHMPIYHVYDFASDHLKCLYIQYRYI